MEADILSTNYPLSPFLSAFFPVLMPNTLYSIRVVWGTTGMATGSGGDTKANEWGTAAYIYGVAT